MFPSGFDVYGEVGFAEVFFTDDEHVVDAIALVGGLEGICTGVVGGGVEGAGPVVFFFGEGEAHVFFIGFKEACGVEVFAFPDGVGDELFAAELFELVDDGIGVAEGVEHAAFDEVAFLVVFVGVGGLLGEEPEVSGLEAGEGEGVFVCGVAFAVVFYVDGASSVLRGLELGEGVVKDFFVGDGVVELVFCGVFAAMFVEFGAEGVFALFLA